MKSALRGTYLDAIDEAEEHTDLDDKKIVSSKTAAIFKHRELIDVYEAERDLQKARDEWDNIGFSHDVMLVKQTEPITCEEVLNYFRLKNMNQYLKNIKPVRPRKGFEALKYWIAGPPRLHKCLISDRDLFFAIALCPFDSSDIVHMRVLQTLYKCLTGSERDCARYGKHWEDVGFQGVDPGTDLRGVGFLGLLHLLYLVLNPGTTQLYKDISNISKTEKQNFPFCTMGINITRIVLETVRDEVLNRECNRKMDVFQVTNDFYVGVFLRFYTIWSGEGKTVMDSGFVLKDLSNFAKKYPAVIFRDFFNYVTKQLLISEKAEITIEFSNIKNMPLVAKV